MNRSRIRSLSVGRALVVLGLGLLTVAAQAAPFALVVNGVATPLDPPPLVDEGEVLLPGPTISHALGIAVLPTRNPGMWVVSAYGKLLYLRANTKRYLRENQEVEAAHAPRVQAGQMHVPVSLLADNFGLRAATAESRLELTGPGATVRDIRQGSHPDWVRLVIDLSAPACFRWRQDPGLVTLTIPAAEGTPTATYRKLVFGDALAPEVMQVPDPGATTIVVGNRCPTQALVFTLADPPRIVIDLPRQAPQVPGPPQAPEPLQYQRQEPWRVHQLSGSRGPAVAYVLTLPVGSGRAKLRPVLASDTIWGRSRLSAIASAAGAYAGLNGGYFARGGGPLGMVMIDREWIKEPILGRTVLGVMQDGSLQMANVRFDGRITLPGAGALALDALNSGHDGHDQVVLYTGRWGAPVTSIAKGTRVMLSAGGEVLAVNAEGRGMEIPAGGAVLSVVGSQAQKAAAAKTGGVAYIQLATDPPWPGLRHALGGGPRLVAGGRPYVTSGTEHFRSDVASGAAPRSALGLLPNGDVVLVAVDGRQAGYSAGLTLSELASFLVDLGCRDAMNFDGGGSATLVVNGEVANQPSDGGERAVSTALLAFRTTRK